MAASRVAGRGSVDVTGGGVTVDGRIVGGESPIPPWASLAVLGAGLLISALVPHAERFLPPATVVVVGVILWFRYRAEFGVVGAFHVPWAEVEHVVRLPSAPDVVGIVFARPLAGAGSPEQVFFAPAAGVEPFVATLRAAAPGHLTWDLESAATGSAQQSGADEDDDGDDPDA
jgi:hypothetical protein